jgi:hypothetical protein
MQILDEPHMKGLFGVDNLPTQWQNDDQACHQEGKRVGCLKEGSSKVGLEGNRQLQWRWREKKRKEDIKSPKCIGAVNGNRCRSEEDKGSWEQTERLPTSMLPGKATDSR